MAETFSVDVWSDVVCPFCYLGSRQLARALAQFEHADDVEVLHHAFELDPRTPLTINESLEELVARKYADRLKKVIDDRLEEMKGDDRSHVLIYQVLGVGALDRSDRIAGPRAGQPGARNAVGEPAVLRSSRGGSCPAFT